MHDLNYFRDHLERFEQMARHRGVELDFDGFRGLDRGRRDLITAAERLKAERNKASDKIARLKKSGQDASGLIAEMKRVSEEIKQDDERIAQLDERLRVFLLTIPNLPHASVPVGASAEDNVEVRRWGAPASSTCPEPRRSPERGLRSTAAPGRAWSGRWRTSFSMCTRSSTGMRRSCRRSPPTAPRLP